MKHLKIAASIVNLTILVFCTLSCSSVPPSPRGSSNAPAAAFRHGVLASCIPDAVINRRAPMMSAAGPQQRLNLAIQLPLRNQAELTQLLHDLYDPKSPDFHKYISVSTFTKRFGPTSADYNKVVAW